VVSVHSVVKGGDVRLPQRTGQSVRWLVQVLLQYTKTGRRSRSVIAGALPCLDFRTKVVSIYVAIVPFPVRDHCSVLQNVYSHIFFAKRGTGGHIILYYNHSSREGVA